MLNVEYPHVVCCANDGTVARVRHKLYREDVGAMACLNRRGEVELVGRRFGVICMNVDAVVVGAGSEETARLRPASDIRYFP